MKNFLIVGVNSQDGFYLSRFLNQLNYDVYGTCRNPEKMSERFQTLNNQCNIVKVDPKIYLEISKLIIDLNPEAIFVLAAESSVGRSFLEPYDSLAVNSMILLNILHAVKEFSPNTRIMNACSSEVFGNCKKIVTSKTPFSPLSPYGYSKAVAANYARMYRDIYDIYVVNLFLFNHESPLRPSNFVTKKVINYVKILSLGEPKESLKLGNLEIKRDWGLAKEYVVAMYKSIQQKYPKDCVICTGEQMTLKKFVDHAFSLHGFNASEFVETDPDFFRKNELYGSVGDINEAKQNLDWKAHTTGPSIIKSLFADD